jgi:CBS domain-containing protein
VFAFFEAIPCLKRRGEFNVTVRRILNAQPKRPVAYIAPDATIAQVLQSPEFEETGALVVSGDGRTLEGIISERDIVRGLGRFGPSLLSKHARDLMTVNVLVCVPDDRAAGIMALMVSRHVRHLPVVADGNLVGMVTVHDLLHLRLEETLSEAEAMRKYIAGN